MRNHQSLLRLKRHTFGLLWSVGLPTIRPPIRIDGRPSVEGFPAVVLDAVWMRRDSNYFFARRRKMLRVSPICR
jgi:hypothetical protein